MILKIHDILTQHVKSQILNCLQAMKKGSKFEQIQKEYSWQAFDVARKIMFTSEIQKICDTTSGDEQTPAAFQVPGVNASGFRPFAP